MYDITRCMYTYILANMDARVGCELLPLATDLLVTRAMPFPLLAAAVVDVELDCIFDFLEAVDCKRRVATNSPPVFLATKTLKLNNTASWESK